MELKSPPVQATAGIPCLPNAEAPFIVTWQRVPHAGHTPGDSVPGKVRCPRRVQKLKWGDRLRKEQAGLLPASWVADCGEMDVHLHQRQNLPCTASSVERVPSCSLSSPNLFDFNLPSRETETHSPHPVCYKPGELEEYSSEASQSPPIPDNQSLFL